MTDNLYSVLWFVLIATVIVGAVLGAVWVLKGAL
jgi:hypothetical protein